MYSLTLFIHSWLRWILVAAMLIVIFRAFKGWRQDAEFQAVDNKLRLITVILFDLQIIIGLYLYFFLSPIVKVVKEPDVNWMQDSQLRFYILEHMFAMVIAVIVLHVGNVFIKKADTSRKKFKRLAITMTCVFLLVLSSIPWPFLPYGRILFRGL